jgi:hypothetical protein
MKFIHKNNKFCSAQNVSNRAYQNVQESNTIEHLLADAQTNKRDQPPQMRIKT